MGARIAIVGAGIGGLACARVLQRRGMAVTVFERDAGPAARAQGGMLDIHPDTGQRALRIAGLWESFHALARPEAQVTRRVDHRSGEVLGEQGSDEDRPEIDRSQLRGLLLDALAPGTVRWGTAAVGVQLNEGTATLRHAGGETEFDLVIGADGAWSKVRPALSDATPGYLGVTFVEAVFAAHERPDLAELVGPGTMLAKADAHTIFGQRNGDGSIHVYGSMPVPADWPDGGDVRTRMLARFEGWHPALVELLRQGDAVHPRPLYVLPVGHRWTHRAEATLLGDAAHLMPPMGIGANLALLDGAELGVALSEHAAVGAAVAAYEQAMLPRATEQAAWCAEMFAALNPEVVNA